MILHKEIPFSFEEKDYKIKVFYEENLINIVAFRKNYPANGFRHQIQIPKSVSTEKILESDAVKDYVELCKKDISAKRWERLI